MLTSRARSAMRALLDLSVHFGEGPIRIEEISERQNIPLKYLQQILLLLKSKGFVESRKGPGGGYMLAKNPAEFNVAEVLRAVDGPIAPISCVSVYSYEACGCPDPETCSLRKTFFDVRAAIVDVLESTSFQRLTEEQGRPVMAHLEPLI